MKLKNNSCQFSNNPLGLQHQMDYFQQLHDVLEKIENSYCIGGDDQLFSDNAIDITSMFSNARQLSIQAMEATECRQDITLKNARQFLLEKVSSLDTAGRVTFIAFVYQSYRGQDSLTVQFDVKQLLGEIFERSIDALVLRASLDAFARNMEIGIVVEGFWLEFISNRNRIRRQVADEIRICKDALRRFDNAA